MTDNPDAPSAALEGRSPRLAAGGLLLLGAAAALAAVAVSATLAGTQIFWGAIALAMLCTGLLLIMPALAGYDGLGLGAWRIGSWSLAWGALAFGLATIGWPGPRAGLAGMILPGSITRALWMIAAAMVMLATGYCLGPHRLAARCARGAARALVTSRLTEEVRSPAVPWALFGAGAAAQAGFAILTGRFGFVGDAAAAVSTASGYAQYLAVAGDCVPLAVAAATVRAYRVRLPGAWLSLAALFAAAIAIGAVAGGKESFVVVVLAVLIPRATVKRRIPVGAVAAALAFFLLVVIPFNLAYRASARGAVTISASQAIAAAPAIAGRMLATDASPSLLPKSASYLAERIRTIDSPAIIAQRTPGEIPYSSPLQLVASPLIDLVPRILWPGKPILAVGYQVSQEYYHLPPQVYTSSDVTPEGDLYRHGGWAPLLAGMFLLGAGFRVFDEAADLRRGVHGAFLIILVLPELVLAGTDFATPLAGMPGMVLLWLAVTTVSFTRRPAPGVVTAPAQALPPPAHTRPPSRRE
jgi:hypothetical protein